MHSKLFLLPATALTLALGACTARPESRGLESVHQAVVTRSDFVFDMSDAYGSDASQRLATWFDTVKLRYGDRVSVDDPSNNAANRAAVAAVANRYGIVVEDTAPVTQGVIAPGSFRVVVSRATAAVPGCPDWGQPAAAANYNGETLSNFGCGFNSSLAAMVADPEDLVRGKEREAVGYNKLNSRSRANGGNQ
jgi:pilus assembly protein CpaD